MTGINDFREVMTALQHVVHWQFLGLELGIPYSGLVGILHSRRDIRHCKMDMLALWLEQDPNHIYRMGVPSWSFLKEALRNIGENELADTIPTDGEFDCLLYMHIICMIYMYYWKRENIVLYYCLLGVANYLPLFLTSIRRKLSTQSRQTVISPKTAKSISIACT